MQMGFRMKRKRPQNPMYFDRHPADHNRIMYSTPKNTTKHISIQNNVSFANSAYISIVDKTLNIKHTNTSINLHDHQQQACFEIKQNKHKKKERKWKMEKERKLFNVLFCFISHIR